MSSYQMLYFFVFFDNILIAMSKSEKLYVDTSITTYSPDDLLFWKFVPLISAIHCALLCLNGKHCMANEYDDDVSMCRLYEVKGHLTDKISQQTFYVKGCPELNDQPNAALTSNNLMTIGSTQTYGCNLGYIMSGSDTVTCQPDGTWSPVNFQCHEMVNVALMRSATQSSTLGNSNNNQASNAVDGEPCGMVAHTAIGDTNRWWLVDFDQTAVVGAISIWNRNTCGKRLVDISILIGSSLDKMELCAYYGGPGTSGETVELKCYVPMPGQYMKITGGGIDTDCDNYAILQFCEIVVMGYFPE